MIHHPTTLTLQQYSYIPIILSGWNFVWQDFLNRGTFYLYSFIMQNRTSSMHCCIIRLHPKKVHPTIFTKWNTLRSILAQRLPKVCAQYSVIILGNPNRMCIISGNSEPFKVIDTVQCQQIKETVLNNIDTIILWPLPRKSSWLQYIVMHNIIIVSYIIIMTLLL